MPTQRSVFDRLGDYATLLSKRFAAAFPDAALSARFEQRLSGTDELWEGVLGSSVNTGAIVLEQPLATQERIRADLERLAEPHHHGRGIEVPVSVRIASARRLVAPAATTSRNHRDEPRSSDGA